MVSTILWSHDLLKTISSLIFHVMVMIMVVVVVVVVVVAVMVVMTVRPMQAYMLKTCGPPFHI